MIPTALGVSVLVFSLLHLAPGDPSTIQFSGMTSGQSTVGGDQGEAIAKFRERYLLDEPIWRQYLHYLGPFDWSAKGHPWLGGSGEKPWHGLLAGDLGNEFRRPTVKVVHELGRRLRVTVPLALIGVLLSYAIAIPIGVYSAVRRGSLLDVSSTVLLFVLYAIPSFWAALMLQLVMGKAGLDLLPVIGLHSPGAEDLGTFGRAVDTLKHLALPIAVYTYGSFAYLSRQMRGSMIETISQDYIRTARAKGLSERVVVLKHALRNSAIPILTLLASVLPVLIGGSIIIETVFDIPGVGSYAFTGLQLREYNVIMATVLFSSLLTMLGFLLSDITYALVDPRIRYE